MSRSSSRSAASDGARKLVSCPQCGTSVVWDPSNRLRPFCSERCKMIDLGAWATESYRIPVAEENEMPEEDDPGGGVPSADRN